MFYSTFCLVLCLCLYFPLCSHLSRLLCPSPSCLFSWQISSRPCPTPSQDTRWQGHLLHFNLFPESCVYVFVHVTEKDRKKADTLKWNRKWHHTELFGGWARLRKRMSAYYSTGPVVTPRQEYYKYSDSRTSCCCGRATTICRWRKVRLCNTFLSLDILNKLLRNTQKQQRAINVPESSVANRWKWKCSCLTLTFSPQ